MAKTEGEALAIERRLVKLREVAAKRAEAKAEYDYLYHFRKSHLAILEQKYQVLDPVKYKTNAAQVSAARSDKDYLDTLTALKEATQTFEKLDWELRIAMKGADLWQTTQANLRHERKQYGA